MTRLIALTFALTLASFAHFDGTLSTFLYDDVIISGGTVSTAIAPLAPTDAGKIFGQLIGKFEAKITQNFTVRI